MQAKSKQIKSKEELMLATARLASSPRNSKETIKCVKGSEFSAYSACVTEDDSHGFCSTRRVFALLFGVQLLNLK